MVENNQNNQILKLNPHIFDLPENRSSIILLSIQQMSNSSPSQQQKTQEIQPSPAFQNYLPPANPIITKDIDLDSKPPIRIQNISNDYHISYASNPLSNSYQKSLPGTLQPKKRDKNTIKKGEDTSGLHEEYSSSIMLYKKYNNQSCNLRDNTRYISSIFIKKDFKNGIVLPQVLGKIKDDQLQFDSNFPSGNLMLVYKKANNTYDLLLQNDANTGGCTQWYNFKVKNKRNNFVATFNIVNLYKSDSLYNQGMKPCVRSFKSDKTKKNWRRRGFNIFYEHNDIPFQDNPKKHYKTLTFEYDFTVQNDTVQFAHSMPYDLEDLSKIVQTAKDNPKATIHSIGNTYMGRPIPVIKIKALEKTSVEKKAIIIMARQHPGQTVGSYIIQEMIEELLRSSAETDFLIWRYDVYVIPMVNMDGVAVGNYRSNFVGFDLNRCWERADPKLHPQPYAIKSFIRKIAKKQQIELILDLHGHSRKMGSFFYGNNIGKNPMLFPYIASKSNNSILFEESRFSSERGGKAQTARVALGKIIKSTGNVYTYEVSFYGHYKQDKTPFSFNENHYRDLGKSLIISMYRTYMEMYKEEKSLKQSLFLKSMKKQIQQLKEIVTVQDDEDSGSDSQAEQIMKTEVKKLQNFYSQTQEESNKEKQKMEDEQLKKSTKNQKTPRDKKQTDAKPISDLLGSGRARQYFQVRHMIKTRFPSVVPNQPMQSEEQLQRELQEQRIIEDEMKRAKKSHNHRLKIVGQNYELKSRIGSMSERDSSLKKELPHRQMRTIQIKRNPEKKFGRGQKHEKHDLFKSYNTIDNTMLKQAVIRQSQMMKQKDKYRNRSLTLKEVTPVLNDNLVSDNAKANFFENPTIRTDGKKKPNVVIEYLGKNIKLPLL